MWIHSPSEFEARCQSKGIDHERLDAQTLSLKRQERRVPKSVLVRWLKNGQVIQVIAPLELVIPPGVRKEISLFLADLDNDLLLPGLEISQKTGHVRFRYCLLAEPNRAISEATLVSAINSALDTAQRVRLLITDTFHQAAGPYLA